MMRHFYHIIGFSRREDEQNWDFVYTTRMPQHLGTELIRLGFGSRLIFFFTPPLVRVIHRAVEGCHEAMMYIWMLMIAWDLGNGSREMHLDAGYKALGDNEYISLVSVT